MKIAVIPARGGSKRIPGKNTKPFLGRPIIGYSIEAALSCGLFDHVIVSTDSQEVATTAREEGAEVPFLRPEDIAGDHTPVLDVLRHAVRWYQDRGTKVDNVSLIYATAPFLRAEDLANGFKALGDGGYRSSMSVARFTYPVQRALQMTAKGGLEMIHKEHLLTRSQDLPDAYMDAAQFIWTSPETLEACSKSLLECGVAPVVLPTSRVQDIDTLEDWDRAEVLYQALEARASTARQASE